MTTTPTATPIDGVAPAREARASGIDEQAGLLMLGGGLLIVAAGAAAVGLSRRRRPAETLRQRADISATDAPPRERIIPMPVVKQPVAVSAPVTAAARNTAMPGTDRISALVAAPPSPENPFLTRKSRLRRAHWLVRTGQVEPTQAARTPIAAQAADRWSETRISGSKPGIFNWRPSKA